MRRGVALEERRRAETVHAGELNIHQDEVRLLGSRQCNARLRIRRLEHAVSRRLEQECR